MASPIYVKGADGGVYAFDDPEAARAALAQGATQLDDAEAANARQVDVMGRAESAEDPYSDEERFAAVKRGDLRVKYTPEQDALARSEKFKSSATFGLAGPDRDDPAALSRVQQLQENSPWASMAIEGAAMLPGAILATAAGGAGAAALGGGLAAKGLGYGAAALAQGGQAEMEISRGEGEEFNPTRAAVVGIVGEIAGAGASWALAKGAGVGRNLVAKASNKATSDVVDGAFRGGIINDYRAAAHAPELEADVAKRAAEAFDIIDDNFNAVAGLTKKQGRIAKQIDAQRDPMLKARQDEVRLTALVDLDNLAVALRGAQPAPNGKAGALAREVDAAVEALRGGEKGGKLFKRLDDQRRALQGAILELEQSYADDPTHAWLSREGLEQLHVAEKAVRGNLVREDVWGQTAAKMQKDYNQPFHEKFFPANKIVNQRFRFGQDRTFKGFVRYRGEQQKILTNLVKGDEAGVDNYNQRALLKRWLEGVEDITKVGFDENPTAAQAVLDAVHVLRRAPEVGKMIASAVERHGTRLARTELVGGALAGVAAVGPAGAVAYPILRGARMGQWLGEAIGHLKFLQGAKPDMTSLFTKGAPHWQPKSMAGQEALEDILESATREAPTRPMDSGTASVSPESPTPSPSPSGDGGVTAKQFQTLVSQLKATGEKENVALAERLTKGEGKLRQAKLIVDEDADPNAGTAFAEEPTPADPVSAPGTPSRDTPPSTAGVRSAMGLDDAPAPEAPGMATMKSEAEAEAAIPIARQREAWMKEQAPDDSVARGMLPKPVAPEDTQLRAMREKVAGNSQAPKGPIPPHPEVAVDTRARGLAEQVFNKWKDEAKNAEALPRDPFDALEDALGLVPDEQKLAARFELAQKIAPRKDEYFGELVGLAGGASPGGMFKGKDGGIRYIKSNLGRPKLGELLQEKNNAAAYNALGGMAPEFELIAVPPEYGRLMLAKKAQQDGRGLSGFGARDVPSLAIVSKRLDPKWKDLRTVLKLPPDQQAKYLTPAIGKSMARNTVLQTVMGNVDVLQNTGNVMLDGTNIFSVDVGLTLPSRETAKEVWGTFKRIMAGAARPGAIPGALPKLALEKPLGFEGVVELKPVLEEALAELQARFGNARGAGPATVNKFVAKHYADLPVRAQESIAKGIDAGLQLTKQNISHLALFLAIGFPELYGGGQPAAEGGEGAAPTPVAAAALPLAAAFGKKSAMFRLFQDRIVSQTARALFASGPRAAAGQVARTAYSRAAAKQRQEQIAAWQANPEELIERISSGLSEASPEATGSAAVGSLMALKFLYARIPQTAKLNLVSARDIPVGEQSLRTYALYERAALRPTEALQAAQREGRLAPETIETLEALYPDLLAELRVAAVEQVQTDGPPKTMQARLVYAQLFNGDGRIGDPAFSPDVTAAVNAAIEQTIGDGTDGKPKGPASGGGKPPGGVRPPAGLTAINRGV